MAYIRRDDTVTDATGNAISGAQVYYCLQPANVSSLPPSPLANVRSNSSGTIASNPQITDGFGHAVAYLQDGQLYTIVYVYPNGLWVVYADQFVGSTSGSPTPFSYAPAGAINGSNTAFTLTTVPSLLFLTLNGQTLTPGLGYTQSGLNITMANAPQVGDTLWAQGF